MLAVGQVCQALEVNEQTFHRRPNQYGGTRKRPCSPLAIVRPWPYATRAGDFTLSCSCRAGF
jgi:hypothetical protein